MGRKKRDTAKKEVKKYTEHEKTVYRQTFFEKHTWRTFQLGGLKNFPRLYR